MSTPPHPPPRGVVVSLVLCICFVGGCILRSVWAVRRGLASGWYDRCVAPQLEGAVPPRTVFRVAWTAWYLLLAWGLWKATCHRLLYALVLCLQVMWCIAFFERRDPRSAAVWAGVLVLAAIVLAWADFGESSRLRASLLILHALWCGVALLWNLGVMEQKQGCGPSISPS